MNALEIYRKAWALLFFQVRLVKLRNKYNVLHMCGGNIEVYKYVQGDYSEYYGL